jgi:hypothetical protein
MDTKDAGRIGGKRRAAKMTPKQRSEAARLAVQGKVEGKRGREIGSSSLLPERDASDG